MSEYILKENEDGSVVTVKDVQKILLEILTEFDRIVNENDLDYTLAYGSELGAIRHGGFIPWDDDIDIFMEREDYFKLVEVLKTDLKSPFYFECYETNDKYNTIIPAMKIKIEDTHIEQGGLIKNRLNTNGLFIDIFLLDNISNSKTVHFLQRVKSTLIMSIIVLLDLVRIDSRFFTRLLYNHARKYHERNIDSEYSFVSITWTFDTLRDQRVHRSDVFPSVPFEFEGQMFRVSNNSHKVLEVMYGPTYMQLPKEESRIPHHIKEIEINR